MTGATARPARAIRLRNSRPTDEAAPEPTIRDRGSWLASAGAAAVPAVLMLVIASWGLGRHNAMGNDEVATWWASGLSLGQLAHVLNHVDAVHGAYYVFMHVWSVLGRSPIVMRLPSVLAMTAAVALIVRLGGRLTGSGAAGVLAGLVAALTPSISYYAQTARSYALVFAGVAASTLLLLRALDTARDPHVTAPLRARRWIAYGALILANGYLNEMSLLVLAAHAATVLLSRQSRRTAGQWLLTAAAATVGVVPLIVVSQREQNVLDFLSAPGWKDVGVLFHDYFGASIVAAVILAGCAAVSLLPERAGPTARARGTVTLPMVAAPLLVLPAALLLIASTIGRPLYIDRYVLYGEIGAALLAGAGLVRIGRALASRGGGRAELAWAPGLIACLAAVLLQLGVQNFIRTPQSRQFDFGGPASYVGTHAQPGDAVLFFDSFYRRARMGYPQDFRHVADIALAVTPARVGNFRGTNKPFSRLQPIMLAHRRIWVIGTSPFSTRPRGPSITEQAALLRTRFVLTTTRRFRGIVVTLWRQR